MLNAEITITDTVKILSDMFVYVNIIEITNKATSDSLVLLDELRIWY